jgi:hypothetical protein
MDFVAFKDWALLGLLTCGVYIMYLVLVSLERLNVKMAVVIERLSNHDKRIERLEKKK